MSEVIDKLRKLIAHEESVRSLGNLAEAEAFAARIAELLQKHNLQMSDVQRAEDEDKSPVGNSYVNPGSKTGRARKSRSAWRETLAVGVASSMFCRLHIVPGRSTLVFIGREQQRIAAVMLFNFLHDQCDQLCKVEYKKHARLVMFPLSQTKFRQSFNLGFARAIHDRLVADVQRLVSSDQNALILVNRHEKAIDEFLGVKAKSAKDLRRQITSDAYAAGYRKGSEVPTANRPALGDGK